MFSIIVTRSNVINIKVFNVPFYFLGYGNDWPQAEAQDCRHHPEDGHRRDVDGVLHPLLDQGEGLLPLLLYPATSGQDFGLLQLHRLRQKVKNFLN